MKQFTWGLLIIGLATATSLGGSAKVSGQREISTPPTNKPVLIYVVDFELDGVDIKSEKGWLPPPAKLPGALGEVLPPPPSSPKDPQQLARKLVTEMSEALVKDLTRAGFTARRLNRTNNLPSTGWLVRGVFTEVNQGNQLQRAVLGFGKGKTELRVLVDVADLAQGRPKDFYELTTAAQSGKLPGAAALIAFHPAAVAVRFVLAGKDLNRNVKQTAAKIAAEVVARTGSDPRQKT